VNRKKPASPFGVEPGTQPSASNPFPPSGKHPSVRDPGQVVTEAPRVSTSRALRPPAPPHSGGGAPDFAADDDAASTPRPVSGGIALESVPRLVRRPQSLTGLPLDHKIGFVLALIDGETNVQTLIDVAGMPPLEVVSTIEHLVELGVVVLG
jgi:hypothetical protein